MIWVNPRECEGAESSQFYEEGVGGLAWSVWLGRGALWLVPLPTYLVFGEEVDWRLCLATRVLKRKAMLDELAMETLQEKSQHKEELGAVRLRHREREVLGVRARYGRELREGCTKTEAAGGGAAWADP